MKDRTFCPESELIELAAQGDGRARAELLDRAESQEEKLRLLMCWGVPLGNVDANGEIQCV